MEKIKRQVIVLSLVEKMQERGSWCGETHIQKCMYFLQEMLRVPTEYEFILYKHGPYSFDLTDELGDMRANMIIELKTQPYPYGPSHVPGEAAEKLISFYPKSYNKYQEQLEFVAENFSNFGVAELERLATALYVSLEKGLDIPVNSRAAEIIRLKPHIKMDDAISAAARIDQLAASSRILAFSK